VSETPPGERPKWSITWLLRIQRVGRNRRELPAEQEGERRRLNKWLFIAIIGGIIIAEVIFGIWLGILPR
jgi:hypothetical protein